MSVLLQDATLKTTQGVWQESLIVGLFSVSLHSELRINRLTRYLDAPRCFYVQKYPFFFTEFVNFLIRDIFE